MTQLPIAKVEQTNIKMMYSRKFLKFLRRASNKIKRTINKSVKSGSPFVDQLLDLDSANERIAQLLSEDGGRMIARYGNTELMTVANYFGIKAGVHPLKYINGKQEAWWWDETYIDLMDNAGFFNPNPKDLERFCKLMIQDTQEVDLLGSWVKYEVLFSDKLNTIPKTRLQFLEPYFSKNPWTKALKGKRVLVVHPFARSIQTQYAKRHLLFDNPDILPDFASLEVIPAVQSIGNGDDRFSNWFEALDWMKSEIDKRDYDVCLIGCGAYGFPLAAHVKRQGKKAVHLGGALQLLFGIRGRRWDGQNYGVNIGFKPGQYASLPNESWVRPAADERPTTAAKVENACYW